MDVSTSINAPSSSSFFGADAANPLDNKAEALRLLSIADKLLQNRDLVSCKEFAVLAQETEPLLDGSDQIMAVVDILLSADKRVNNHHDWYAILQVDRHTETLDLIKKQYRRLALLLHPDKNKFSYADSAFKLVADAWAVLNDSTKKSQFDREIGAFYTKVDLVRQTNQISSPMQKKRKKPEVTPQKKLPIRRSARVNKEKVTHEEEYVREEEASVVDERKARLSSFWTACPYCYQLYEYPRVYEGCCLRCQNCRKAFHGALLPSMPPLVPGKEAYYCCWGFFPLGFTR